uniref:histidine kinase n=1 Tax=Solibacter usitatus (strain Ellin6076) TaxID=234267 RepID=Q01QG1_SOLUE
MTVTDEMYRRVVMAVPEGIWVVDPEGRTIFSNQRMAEILGVAFESMPQQSCFTCVYPEDADSARSNFARALAGDRRPFDFRLQRADGSPVWVSITCMPMNNDDGVPFGLLGMFSEITERKLAVDALRASEERLWEIINVASVGVAQTDLTARLEMVNDRFCAIFGYAREELLGKSLRELSHPDDLLNIVEQTRRLLSGEIPYLCVDKRHIRKDGAIIWSRVHKSCIRDLAGQPTHTIVVLEEITEAVLAQAALKESEERFRAMADSAPVLISLWDTGLNPIFCSSHLLAFAGRTEEQLRTGGFEDLVHPDDLERVDAAVRAAVQRQGAFEIEVRMRRADGEYRSMLTNGTPRFAAGTYAGYVMITVDITEFKRKQEYLMAMQKLESLGVLAAGIAHDFNNLLGGILASAELISAGGEQGAPLDEESLLRIRTAAIRGGEIVRQLMAYGGEESQAFSSVEIPQLVNEMLELLKISISKRAVLNVDFPAGLPSVRANTAQLRQVVLNLIVNASEALEDTQGVIAITAARVSGDDYQPAVLASQDYVSLTVSDSGCGMTEEVQARIFDPFFTSKFAGRGLGLASVQGIIRSHGGAIHVTSAPGRGSRFEVLLPVASEPVSEPAAPAEPGASSEGDPMAATVLIVEDEEALRTAVSKMLRLRGFRVLESGDGADALNLLRRNAPPVDVVLLDLNLPGASGPEVLAELQAIRPGAKVILTSAYSRERVQAGLGGELNWPYIRKPYQLAELTALLLSISRGAAGGQ